MNLQEEFENLIKKLEIELKIKGFTKATISTYKRHCLEFLKFVNKEPIKVSVDDVKAYQANLSDKGLKTSSVILKLSSIKFLFHEVIGYELINQKVKYPKREKKIPDALTKEEIKRLFSVVSNKKPL